MALSSRSIGRPNLHRAMCKLSLTGIKEVLGVKIRLPSDDDRLRAGMAADVYFPNVK